MDDTSRTLGSLNVGDPNGSHRFTLAAGGGATLTFDNGGSPAQLNQTATSKGDTLDATLPIGLTSSLIVSNAAVANALTVSGTIGGGGGLTKAGAGGLVLGGNNTFSGATTANAGTLQVNSPGSLHASSAVTVNNNGTLGGTGTVNGLATIANGGTRTSR